MALTEAARTIGTSPRDSASPFLPIRLGQLYPTNFLPFDLYLKWNGGGKPVLYRGKTVPLERGDLDRLTERGVDTLYVAGKDWGAFLKYLRYDVATNVEVPLGVRHRALREAAWEDFEDASEAQDLNGIVHFATEFGAEMVDLLTSVDFVFQELFRQMEHDLQEYTHAINVCTYSVLLANRLNRFGRNDLAALAAGGILHDIGKRYIHLDASTKPNRLTDEQRAVINQHPHAGFAKLRMRKDVEWGQLMMVYQHHERCNGQGFPVRSIGDEIHEWARICSVADGFHMLTAHRPYCKTPTIAEAVESLEEQAGRLYDTEMAKCWIELVSAQH